MLASQRKRKKAMIKKITVILSASSVALAGLLFISAPALASTDCNNLKGCERKFCEIERQLNIAQQKNNERKADGLKKALDEAKGHCTDKGLKEGIIQKIDEVNEEISEYESDLKEAKEYGKTGKVRKYQEKIEEEKIKLKHLENELSNSD
jgi:hypothetical protein